MRIGMKCGAFVKAFGGQALLTLRTNHEAYDQGDGDAHLDAIEQLIHLVTLLPAVCPARCNVGRDPNSSKLPSTPHAVAAMPTHMGGASVW